MSDMTIQSASIKLPGQGHGEKVVDVEALGADSYETGGSVVDLSSYFNGTVKSINVTAQGTTQYTGQYVSDSDAPATAKVVIFTAGTQATAAADHSGVTFNLRVTGTD